MSEVVSAFEHTLVGYDEHGASPPVLELVLPIEPEEPAVERGPHVDPVEAAYALAQGPYLGRIAAARVRLQHAEAYDPQTHESGLSLASWVLPSIRAELRRRYHELVEFEASWAARFNEPQSGEGTEETTRQMSPQVSVTADAAQTEGQPIPVRAEQKVVARNHQRTTTTGTFFTADPNLPHGKLPPESKLSATNGLGRELTLLSNDKDKIDPRKNGLCAQTDPDAFFPEKGGSTKEAKRVCMACDAREKCLDYALDNDERFGIWGGLSERERRKLKKKRA